VLHVGKEEQDFGVIRWKKGTKIGGGGGSVREKSRDENPTAYGKVNFHVDSIPERL